MSFRNSRNLATVLAIGVLCLCGPAHAAVEELIAGVNQPVRLIAPEGDPRLFVVERGGLIRIFDQQGNDQGVFLDLSAETVVSGERGLLGLAFPPDYATTGRFYVDYTNLSGDTRIARYTVSANDPDRADPASGEILLAIAQPAANHNGGHLAFGPDGMLYVALGDGGGSAASAQDDQRLLGKLLRIDVSGATGYSIPPDNPFVDQDALPEIWAKGVRNPWSFDFDPLTGDLYIADVGQSTWEEIDVRPAATGGGENYGWPLMEGPDCNDPPSGCNDGSLILPVHAYPHGGDPYRCSISGGYVYRGSRIPSLQGEYFYSDYCSREILSLRWNQGGSFTVLTDRTAEMTPPGGYGSVASFGRDGLGELYVLDLDGGRVFRIVDAASGVPRATAGFTLEQNAPNPFNPSTEIRFTLDNDAAHVRLEVFDTAGRRVKTLYDGTLPAGDHGIRWDARDRSGRSVGSGLYLARLEVDGVTATRKMALLE